MQWDCVGVFSKSGELVSAVWTKPAIDFKTIWLKIKIPPEILGWESDLSMEYIKDAQSWADQVQCWAE